MDSRPSTGLVANAAEGETVRAANQPRPRTRVSDAILREQLDHAMRTATTLLSENYLAQDRHRLIRCIEAMNEATKAIEGGMWTGELAPDPGECAPAAAPPPPRASGLIVRDATPAPVRSVA